MEHAPQIHAKEWSAPLGSVSMVFALVILVQTSPVNLDNASMANAHPTHVQESSATLVPAQMANARLIHAIE